MPTFGVSREEDDIPAEFKEIKNLNLELCNGNSLVSRKALKDHSYIASLSYIEPSEE